MTALHAAPAGCDTRVGVHKCAEAGLPTPAPHLEAGELVVQRLLDPQQRLFLLAELLQAAQHPAPLPASGARAQ